MQFTLNCDQANPVRGVPEVVFCVMLFLWNAWTQFMKLLHCYSTFPSNRRFIKGKLFYIVSFYMGIDIRTK